MSRDHQPQVVLLRAPDAKQPDRYIKALQGVGLRAVCVPVLRFDFVNPLRVRAALRATDIAQGWVFTSPRAVDAVARSGSPDNDSLGSTVAYTVGAATAEAAAGLGFRTAGVQSGDARKLAEFIVTQHDPSDSRPYYFVCGNRRRQELPAYLREAGLVVHEIVAYVTALQPPDVDPAEFDVAVWFSPSGVEAVLQKGDRVGRARWNRPRHAAIGPTTAAALRVAGVPPAIVADAPAPSALAKALSTLLSSDDTR